MEKLSATNKWLIFFIPVCLSLASFVMGYFMVYHTWLQEYMQKQHGYSQEQSQFYFTLTSALLAIGAFLATFLYSRLVQTYGENTVLRLMDVLGMLAIGIQLMSMNVVAVSVSRFLMGIFCGIISGVVPSYILSLAPSFTSGIVGTYNQVAVALGMAFAYYMGQLLDDHSFSEATAVRLLIGMPLICLLVHLVMLFLHPYDNIQRHIMRRENVIIRKYLKTVYGANWKSFEAQIRYHKTLPVQIEPSNKSTRDIYEEENLEQRQNKPCCQIKKKNFILLAVMLGLANQFSGIGVLQQYAKQLFLTIQQGDQDEADFSVLILGFFQVLVTFCSGFIINHYGRRPAMLSGISIFTLALLFGFASTSLVQRHERITILAVFLHLLGYSISLGPLMMMYAVEALESVSLVIMVNWGLYSIISLAGDYFIESIGLPALFLTFAIGSLLSGMFFYIYMVQTMGTPRKRVWEEINGVKMEWQKSFNAMISESDLKKRQEQVQKLAEGEGGKQAVEKSKGTI